MGSDHDSQDGNQHSSQERGPAPAPIQPPVAYLPCRLTDEGELDRILLARLRDGRVALMGYTALDRFMAACGDAHPWVLYRSEDLEELRREQPFDVAYLDVALPRELRQLSGAGGAS